MEDSSSELWRKDKSKHCGLFHRGEHDLWHRRPASRACPIVIDQAETYVLDHTLPLRFVHQLSARHLSQRQAQHISQLILLSMAAQKARELFVVG